MEVVAMKSKNCGCLRLRDKAGISMSHAQALRVVASRKHPSLGQVGPDGGKGNHECKTSVVEQVVVELLSQDVAKLATESRTCSP
jgi:hypothetical protein